MNLKLVLPTADEAWFWLKVRTQASTQNNNPIGLLSLEELRQQIAESKQPLSEKAKVHRFFIQKNNLWAGVISLKDINWQSGVAEVGYLIDESFQNQGVASEALKQIIQLAFAAGLNKIKATTSVENGASNRVLEKNNFQKEGLLREEFLINKKIHDVIMWAIFRNDVTGFRIRQLTENDWSDFRNLRLESLAQHPAFFAPTHDETKFSEAQWRERLSNKNAAFFGIFDESKIVGLTGIRRENDNPTSERAVMMASYIKKDYRGKNLSRLFYEARIQWARNEKNIKSLLIFHRDGNLVSKNANQRFGFKYLSSFKKTYLDGSEGLSFCYELKL